MPKNNEKLTPEEKLQQENNLLKAKLIAENGAHFYENDDSEISSEMENKWLKYLSNYEKMQKKAKIISVYEKIGKPEFKASHAMDDTELSNALDTLIDKMDQNGIQLACLADDYEDRVIYEFITTELFDHEIEDMKMEGLYTCFTYEDFHPNHDYDLRRQSEDFITSLLSLEWHEIDDTFLHDTITDANGAVMSKNEFRRKIHRFQESFHSFNILKMDITRCWFDLEKGKATVEMTLSYKALTETGEKSRISGKAVLSLLIDNDFWNIENVAVPGFNS